MKLTEEKFVAFCKRVLPLPTELNTCRTCLALELCLQRKGPVERCPLIVVPSALDAPQNTEIHTTGGNQNG